MFLTSIPQLGSQEKSAFLQLTLSLFPSSLNRRLVLLPFFSCSQICVYLHVKFKRSAVPSPIRQKNIIRIRKQNYHSRKKKIKNKEPPRREQGFVFHDVCYS